MPPEPLNNQKISTGIVKFLRLSNIELYKGLKELLNLEGAQEYDGKTTLQPIIESYSVTLLWCF